MSQSNSVFKVGDDMWFSVDSCDDVEFHETEDEARNRAQSSLDVERDNASDGWYDGVTNIAWGEVRGRIKETLRRPYDPDEDSFVTSCDEIVDYALVDIANDKSKHEKREIK